MNGAASLLGRGIDAFVAALSATGVRRAAFVRPEHGAPFAATAPSLADLAEQIGRHPDFDGHEAAFFEVGGETGALHSAFVHLTVRGQGAGGVRHWPYASLGDLVSDGLRLSRGMGRKNALAGLHWGGGKGVIARKPGDRHRDPSYRTVLYREFGAFVSSLRGVYVTAEDVGTTPPDMAEVFRATRFTTCIPEALGGSGNPSMATAKGVVCAMEAALDHIGLGSLDGKTVAMQGAGNVGAAMIGDLLAKGVAKIVVTDVTDRTEALARFPADRVTFRVVDAGDTSVFGEPCDVFAPNALGASLNPRTIPLLACRVVCGAANNQLEDERRDDLALAARGVAYVPDFVANRMGIVSCANEQYGSLPADPAIERHFGRDWDNAVYVVTRRILAEADALGTTSSLAANALADRLSLEAHPLFPGRGRAIERALVAERWHEKAP
jgi:glutamate dehydrogenase/leucine dehydrogenase